MHEITTNLPNNDIPTKYFPNVITNKNILNIHEGLPEVTHFIWPCSRAKIINKVLDQGRSSALGLFKKPPLKFVLSLI